MRSRRPICFGPSTPADSGRRWLRRHPDGGPTNSVAAHTHSPRSVPASRTGRPWPSPSRGGCGGPGRRSTRPCTRRCTGRG
jgi:hypothetical protein